MKKLLLLVVLLTMASTINANDYTESFNVVSGNYANEVEDVKIIRPINGGTVIIPLFNESCPEEMKAPFAYACKIVEEYMPPCMPLKVKVSCGRVNSSAGGAVSRVRIYEKENFGSTGYSKVQMSVIKGVILSELCYESTYSYLDYVPDVDFLTEKPDIEIIYNSQKLDEMSFSLEPDPGNNYDFVSLALRDLLKGLGITSDYLYNPVINGLNNPARGLSPFESFISSMLGNHDDPKIRLENATKGKLLLHNREEGMTLYAPSPWVNGHSLNYFIPQDDCSVSKILSYDFCKGMVTRSLADDYNRFIFTDLLGWKPNFLVSTSTPDVSTAGNTSLRMPYNGSITFNDSNYGVRFETEAKTSEKFMRLLNQYENEELYNYVLSFHPFLYEGTRPSEGTSISVLKKDGSWDLVKYASAYIGIPTFSMSDWTFHCDESEYARTIDGYLRARITTKRQGSYGKSIYNSTYFVIDYLPQKVGLSYSFVNTPSTKAALSTETSKTVRIYFSNTEGVNRIVLEQLRQGARLPSKIDIYTSEMKRGYYETTVDRPTTFTAVGYNDNGMSRGVPITVTPTSEELSLNFKVTENNIIIDHSSNTIDAYDYTIATIDLYGSTSKSMDGTTSGCVDISMLPNGLYVLTIKDKVSGICKSFKFKI